MHAWTGLHNIAQITTLISGLLSAQIQFTESQQCLPSKISLTEVLYGS